ncbi:MAG TPA: radical SAM protein [bacterium]|nr:radical SAM protein [bacterium]
MSKKRVLLVGPLSEEHAGIENFGIPPLGVHRIAAYLRDWGHDVDIYDCNISLPFDEIYKEKNFDVIGISLLNEPLGQSLQFIRKLRELYPKAKIIAGGIEASLNYQFILDHSPVDAVCLAEGEEVMHLICNGEFPLGVIEGLVVKNYANPITNDKLWDYWNKVDFSKLGYREYWKYTKKIRGGKENHLSEPLVRLVTSSHCLRNCTYCSTRLWHLQACGSKVPVAYLSAEQIDILLTRIKKQLPETKQIYFVDDNFIVTRRRIYNLVPILKKHSFHYRVQTSTNMLTEDIVKNLAEVGTFHITCGVENASAYVRDSLNKHQDEQKIEDIIRWCVSSKIIPYYLIILFTPKTRIEDLWTNYTKLNQWITKGAMVSIEPLERIYRGAIDYENRTYDMEYRLVDGIRQPFIFLPESSEVRAIMRRFKKEWPEYQKKKAEEKGVEHFYKGQTGKWMIELLGDILRDTE